MQTAQNVSKNTQAIPLPNVSPDLAAPPVPPLVTTGQIMNDSKTPEEKKAAFIALYMGSDETISQAVDHFFKDPILYSQTVQDLAGSTSDKERLKKFLHKMGESQERIALFISQKYAQAIWGSKTISEFNTALRPYFAFKAAFEGIDRNRRAAHSCPSACDLLNNFNKVNNSLNTLYVPDMFKQIAKLRVMSGPE